MTTSHTLNYSKYQSLQRLFPELHPYIFKFALASILLFALGSTIFAFRYLYFPKALLESKVSASTEKEAFIPPRGDAILETHIANNGMVFLKGARVVSVEGTTITVSSTWGQMNFTWVVKTNGTTVGGRHFGTQFYNNNGEKIKVSDLQVGQFIQINGDIDTTSEAPTIIADFVRT